ncbi:MAG: hypothetical protein Q9188_005406 [Gyalolechia gomerana]
MDCNEIRPGPQLVRVEGPSVDHLPPVHRHTGLQPMNTPPKPIAPPWSMQDVATNFAYFPGTSSIGLYPTANETFAPLQSHNAFDQDRLIFPEDIDDVIDFEAFLTSLRTSPPSYISGDGSTTTSTISSSHNSITQDLYSSHEPSSFGSSLPSTKLQPTTSLKMEMKTPCSNSRQSCLSSALETLRTLHIPPSACICSTGTTSDKRQPRKTGAVLEINRTAVRQLSDVLKCSCISSTPFQLVLITICDKLIAWYRAILSGFACQSNETRTNPVTHWAPSYNDITCTATGMVCERVIHQPFAVGDFAFDEDLEGRVREQVIVSELQQLEIVVANLTDLLQEERIFGDDSLLGDEKTGPSSTKDSLGASNGVHARLCAQLQTRLQDTKAETVKYRRTPNLSEG